MLTDGINSHSIVLASHDAVPPLTWPEAAPAVPAFFLTTGATMAKKKDMILKTAEIYPAWTPTQIAKFL